MTPESASIHKLPGAATPSAQVISLGELHPEAQQGPPVVAGNPLHAVRARLQVCVGEFEMTVGELLAAREHQLVQLDRAIDAPVDLLLEGRVVARGQLVAIDGAFGLRITELPLPLKP